MTVVSIYHRKYDIRQFLVPVSARHIPRAESIRQEFSSYGSPCSVHISIMFLSDPIFYFVG